MSKEEMAEKAKELMDNMYYEDVAFVYGMLQKLTEKKGVRANT